MKSQYNCVDPLQLCFTSDSTCTRYHSSQYRSVQMMKGTDYQCASVSITQVIVNCMDTDGGCTPMHTVMD